MAKILSQEEIDALLSTVAEGAGAETEEAAPEVALYDFRHPSLISKEQMRQLENVHETFSRSFGVFLSAQLRLIVEIELLAVDQLLYSEFVMSIVPPGALYVMDIKEPEAQAILEISPRMVIYMVEKLFGGKGSLRTAPTRAISTIEERILKRIMDQAIVELRYAWNPISTVDARLTRFESNPEFIQIVPSTEPVVIVSLQITIYGSTTLFNLCYPYRWVAEMIGRPELQEKLAFGRATPSSEEHQHIEDHLMRTACSIQAFLGDSRMTIGDFLQLQVGDLIVLDSKLGQEHNISVRGIPLLRGIVGRGEKNRAVLVTDFIEEE